MEQKRGAIRFTEALGGEVDSAFKKLASEILKDGALSQKEKSLIALACAVAVKCDQCTRVHKKQALKQELLMKKLWKPLLWRVWCLWVLDLTQLSHF